MEYWFNRINFQNKKQDYKTKRRSRYVAKYIFPKIVSISGGGANTNFHLSESQQKIRNCENDQIPLFKKNLRIHLNHVKMIKRWPKCAKMTQKYINLPP